jgi:outer membrane lipoprotein-sorting protein
MPAVMVRVAHGDDFGEAMKKIRVWLDHHKIDPSSFRTTVDGRGYLLSIDFRSEKLAEIFRKQFGPGESSKTRL